MKRVSKKLVTVFLCFLLLPIYGFSLFQKPKEVIWSFSLPPWKLASKENGSTSIQIQDCISFPNEQGYLLPRSILKIPIPQNYEFSSLTLKSSKQVIDKRIISIIKADLLSVVNSTGVTENSFSGNNPSLLTYVTSILEKNQKQLYFVVCPFSYEPNHKKLSYTVSCTFSISLKKINSDQSLKSTADISASEKYQYCIILPKVKVPLFLEYKSFLEDRGIRTILYPLEEIYASYQQSNNPGNIRSFLKEFYVNHGIETVLLVGSAGTIPMKQFYPTGNKNEEPVLSDLYYAELSSNWDKIPYPGKLETDLKDFDPELAIGRLPLDSDQEITDYLSRILQYYKTIDQRKKSVLCAGAWISFQEDDGIIFRSDMFDIDGGKMAYMKYKTYFPSFSYEGFYEQDGVKKSQVAEFGNSINYANVKGAIWQTNPLIQLLSGHGNYSSIYRKIWSADKNENGIAETDEVSYDPFFDEKSSSSSSLYLVDSCSTCQPDKTNLGMQTIKKSGGGYLGFASEVYFIVSSTCKDPCDFENSTSIYGITGVAAKYLNQQLSIGEATKKSLKHYRDLCFVSLNQTVTQYQTKNIFATCYYGDPYMKLSGYPTHDFDTFTSQGKGDREKVAFGIEDVSIAKALEHDTIKIKTLENLKTGKNYLFSLSIDYNKDKVFDYSFKIGYLNSGNFIQNFYQNDQFKSLFGHYGFRFEMNDFWIQLPRKMLGNDYRYQILLTNTETNQSDSFIGSYPKEDTSPPPPKVPYPPTSLQGTILDGRVSLNWLSSTPGAFPVAGYEIFRQEEGFDFFVINSQEASNLSFIDQFVIGGKTYYYQVRSFDNQIPKNYSSFSNVITVVLPKNDNPPKQSIPPTAPTISKLNNINSQIFLTWFSSVPGSFPIAGYEIFRQENTNQFSLIAMTDSRTLQFNDQFVSSGNTYTYKVRCFDNQSPQNLSVFSTEKSILIQKTSTPKNPETPTILPPSPPLLKGEFKEEEYGNHLVWSKSLVGTFPVAGYELYRKDQESELVFYQRFDAFTNQFLDKKIEENKTYTYFILAMDNQTPPHYSLNSNQISIQSLPRAKSLVTIRLKIGSNIAIVGDRFIVLPLEPFTYKDRTMVPIRFIGEAFGATVNWTEDDSKNGEGVIEIYLLKSDNSEIFVTFHTLEPKALLRVYQNRKLIKDQMILMDVPAFIVKPANRTVVPIRFLAETFNAKVSWNELNEEIQIDFSP